MEYSKLIKASADHKIVIQNLMQLYMHDFSEFMDLNVGADGLFPEYKDLDLYWTDTTNRFPYLILQDEKYAGFLLVRQIELDARNYFSMAEFFVLRNFRNKRLGQKVAFEIFNLHRGNWKLFQIESNHPAQQFWRKVIAESTPGKFYRAIRGRQNHTAI
ncbi:MAG: GNAT family N-acetyltransferase [Bacteroidetes bacterium]|nr:MAG: GNAT family N-acetyltransferase [Bacteroidota bacterium]